MLKLSTQLFAGVMESLQGAVSSGGSEKRQFTRMDVQAPLRLAVMADNKLTRCFIALSRDISLTGIGLWQGGRLAPKETFMISLPCAKQRTLIVCMSTYCRPVADGIFWIGAQFESEADPAQTDEFNILAAAQAKSPVPHLAAV